MQTNMRIAVGTLISAGICVFVTAALLTLPALLSNGGDPSSSEWGILGAMYSVFPAALAAVLFLISFVFFIVAASERHPR